MKRIYIFFVAAGRAERCPAPLLLVGDHSSPPYTFTPMRPATRTQVAPTDPRFSLRTPPPTISQYPPKDVCSKCFAGKRLGLAWNLAGPDPAVKYSSVNTRELHQITSPTKPLAATPRDLVRHLLFYCRIGPVWSCMVAAMTSIMKIACKK